MRHKSLISKASEERRASRRVWEILAIDPETHAAPGNTVRMPSRTGPWFCRLVPSKARLSFNVAPLFSRAGPAAAWISHWWKIWSSSFLRTTTPKHQPPTPNPSLGVLIAHMALDCQMHDLEFLLDGSSSPVEQSTPSARASSVFFHCSSSTHSAADFPLPG